jgi:hypothetical protein
MIFLYFIFRVRIVVFLLIIFVSPLYSIGLDDLHQRELNFSHAFIAEWVFPILDKYIKTYHLKDKNFSSRRYHQEYDSLYFDYINKFSIMETIKIHDYLGLDHILEDIESYSKTPYLKEIIKKLKLRRDAKKVYQTPLTKRVGYYVFNPEKQLYVFIHKKYVESVVQIIRDQSDINSECIEQEHIKVIDTFEDIALNTNLFLLPKEGSYVQSIEKALYAYLFYQSELEQHKFLSLFLERMAQTFFGERNAMRFLSAIKVKPILNLRDTEFDLEQITPELKDIEHPRTFTVSDVFALYSYYMESFYFDAPILKD